MKTNLAYSVLPEMAPQETRELLEADRAQVISLLMHDPVQSVILRGLIQDYGMCGAALRGSFYGHFINQQLVAVALIGHQIMAFGTDEALPYFANKVLEVSARGYLILGPQTQVKILGSYLTQRETRRMSTQRLYVCQQPCQQPDRLQLLLANFAELEVIVEAQAEMALEESGLDPRLTDLAGFRHRVAERVERKRVWVKIEDGKVVFKADVISDTPETVYLEGVWVHPDYRQRGIGKSCLKELAHLLLKDHQSICLLSNDEDTAAQQIYEQAGFVQAATYEARFLAPLA